VTFDLLTLKVVSESHVTWAICVPILVFLGVSFLDLGPMYATDRRQTRIIALCLRPMEAEAQKCLVLSSSFFFFMYVLY